MAPIDHPASCDFEEALAAAARGINVSAMHVTLVVTSAAKIPLLLQLLRSRAISNCWGLVGRMSEDEWMLRALSFVVATPEEVRGTALFSSRLEALVLDKAAVAQNTFFHELLYESRHRKLPVFPAQPRVPVFRRPWQHGVSAMKGWVDPRDRSSVKGELRSSLEETLPEVLSCSGLGDSWFDSAVESFADGDSIVQQDWSAILSYMPGVFHRLARGDKWLTLVLAPDCRAAPIARFMQVFARHFGLPEELVGLQAASRVAVGSPERFHPSNRLSDVCQLILVEADKLFASHRPEMEWIVERLEEDVQIGLHSETLPPEVEDLASRFAKRHRWERLDKAGASMDGIRQFYACVDDESCKLDELCRLCKELRRRFKVQAAVVCNSSARVVEVVEEMRKRGLSAFGIHSGMGEREVELIKRSEQRSVIVTDHGCSKGARDVINFEMPLSPGDYFERASKQRDQVTKVVISLVVGGQECELLDRVRSLYGVDIDLLPSQPKRPVL
ncbi:hypothetical protein SELMODRAFT_428347 [Selaginella moellendorffii]|uniref:Helicase C-terminal domain-containing protein n=1 Tax=Selaginella moellendorffii TaxID=88036 RepID=D8T2J6_SELML|nr:eukaryotic initiation factor 4A-1 [Selaginella moellendorffii]EFJ09070.1 hypothetical protein SELMODRAFT_428347 [Selaginella moellendorffii]|eukprot:XP_002989803.1 eukaryotic initiation factor 4A-1 [Selaginella moellendorffii]